MELSGQLPIVIAGNSFSAALVLAGGLFVLAQNWRRDLNWLFFFVAAATGTYTILFMVASLQAEYDAAYFWWSLTIASVFITMAVVHFVFRVANRHRSWLGFILFSYSVGAVLVVMAYLHPEWFIPQIVQKMHFYYYPDAGWWYTVMLAYFFGFFLIAYANLVFAYRSTLGAERKRFEYILVMLAIAYGCSACNYFLAYDISIDPIWGMFVGFCLIPIGYSVYASDLLDIRIIVRHALFYVGGVAGTAAVLTVLVILNDFLVRTVPGFPFWVVPLVVSIIAFSLGRMAWHQVEEAEHLKYEFITVATHKLRTPLTRIRWVIPEILARAGTDVELREGIRSIDDANNRLIELTNVLMEAAHPGGSFDYQQVPVDLRHLAWEAVKRFSTQISEKKLVVTVDADNAPPVSGDMRRLTIVTEILVENAIMYTPAGGTISVRIKPDYRGVRFAITDTGIGVKREDQQNIFSSFFRTSQARASDTEGVGLGLSLAKAIVERQGGRIGVESSGEGKGSTFWFTMPVAST